MGRCRHEIIYVILKNASKPKGKTELWRGNLHQYVVFRKILQDLVSKGLLQKINGKSRLIKRKIELFKTTEKGFEFYKTFRRYQLFVR